MTSPPSFVMAIVMFCLAALCVCVMSELDYTRVHLIDRIQGNGFTNYVYRTNVPVKGGQMAFESFVQMLKQRASESSITLPEDLYVFDLALTHAGDEDKAEVAYWADPANADKGQYLNWPMGLSGLYDARSYDEATQNVMSNSTVWEFDQIPSRLHTFLDMIHTPGPINPHTGKPRSVVYTVHCAAGCDRTGQFVIAYRLVTMPPAQIHDDTLQSLFKMNVEECGRCPNDWSVKGTEWFCIFMRYNYGAHMGDCLHIADCKRFGNCTWPPA